MSERWNPKKLLRERKVAIAAGATADPALRAEPHAAMATATETLCRAHNQPWRTCGACSSSRKKEP